MVTEVVHIYRKSIRFRYDCFVSLYRKQWYLFSEYLFLNSFFALNIFVEGIVWLEMGVFQ